MMILFNVATLLILSLFSLSVSAQPTGGDFSELITPAEGTTTHSSLSSLSFPLFFSSVCLFFSFVSPLLFNRHHHRSQSDPR